MAQNGRTTLDWAKHEGEIRDLFVSQGKTLDEVRAHMRKKHNFDARYNNPSFRIELLDHQANDIKFSVRQYKSKFPKLKNLKAEEWIWIGQEIERRATLGKKSEPYLHNKPLPFDRVVRETARHKNKLLQRRFQTASR
jgi:hypothetical protein